MWRKEAKSLNKFRLEKRSLKFKPLRGEYKLWKLNSLRRERGW